MIRAVVQNDHRNLHLKTIGESWVHEIKRYFLMQLPILQRDELKKKRSPTLKTFGDYIAEEQKRQGREGHLRGDKHDVSMLGERIQSAIIKPSDLQNLAVEETPRVGRDRATSFLSIKRRRGNSARSHAPARRPTNRSSASCSEDITETEEENKFEEVL